MRNPKKKNTRYLASTASLALLTLAVMPAYASAAAYTDVDSTNKPAIDYLVSKGAQGITASKFGVYQEIKRVDAAVLLAKVLGLNINLAPSSGFTDVPKRAVKYVNALKAAGIVNGKSSKRFDSNSYVTRGEVAIMIQRSYGLEGSSNPPFKDVNNTFKGAVNALYDYGITQGISATLFGTNQPVKRGEFAQFIYRASQVDQSGGDSSSNPSNSDNLAITKTNYLSPTEIEVTFSKEVDSLKPANFSIVGATVSGVKLSTDKKTATLTVKGLEYSSTYNLTVRNVKVGGALQPETSSTIVTLPAPNGVALTEVKYVSRTQVDVSFSKEIGTVKPDQFSIEGATVTAVKLSSNKKTATLTVKNLDYSKTYQVHATGIKLNGEEQAPVSGIFTTASVKDVWEIAVTKKDGKIQSDKSMLTEVSFELKNKETGKVETTANNVIVDIGSSYGTLSQSKVTLKNGKATAILATPGSGYTNIANVTARITEATSAYSQLKNAVTGSLNIAIDRTTDTTPFTLKSVKGYLNGYAADTIEMTFSEGVQLNGTSDAAKTSQYKLNGKSLPSGTTIAVRDLDHNVDNGYEIVLITLPSGSLRTLSNELSVNNKLVSYDSTVITGATTHFFNTEDYWNSNFINEPGTYTGNINLLPLDGIVTSGTVVYGPSQGIRVINGDVTISGDATNHLVLQNLVINGRLYIESAPPTVTLRSSVKVTGDTRIQNGNVKKFFNEGQLSSLWIDSSNGGTTISNRYAGQINTININNAGPITLESTGYQKSLPHVVIHEVTTVFVNCGIDKLTVYDAAVINGFGYIDSIEGTHTTYLTGNNPYVETYQIAQSRKNFTIERDRILDRSLVKNDYTLSTWNELQKWLSFDVRVKDFTAIDTATTNLLEAERHLVLNTGNPQLNIARNALNATIQSAQNLHDNTTEGPNPGNYLGASRSILQRAILDATSVRDKKDSTGTLNATLKELEDAKAALDLAVQTFLTSTMSAN